MAKSEPIRDPRKIEEMEDYYIAKKQFRNYVLFVLGTYTALRISDLLSLQWKHIYNFNKKTFFSHLDITERKTEKTKKIALHEDVIIALKFYLSILPNCTGETWLFPSRKKARPSISRQQAYRIIYEAAREVEIQGNISPHSMRKTLGYHAWKAGVSLTLISTLYNHASEKQTMVYCGITQDEIDEVYLSQNYRSKPRKVVSYEM